MNLNTDKLAEWLLNSDNSKIVFKTLIKVLEDEGVLEALGISPKHVTAATLLLEIFLEYVINSQPIEHEYVDED